MCTILKTKRTYPEPLADVSPLLNHLTTSATVHRTPIFPLKPPLCPENSCPSNTHHASITIIISFQASRLSVPSLSAVWLPLQVRP